MKKLHLLFGLAFLFCQVQNSDGQSKVAGPHIRLALNAYSFNDVLLAKGTPEKPAFTLFDLLDWCAVQNIEGVDVTGYYFPTYPEVPSDEYIYELKRKAFRLGIEITGTGIRNNFASPDPAVRKADVERAKQWIIKVMRTSGMRLLHG
jgi:sugar phosphate isomerase/epimerase